MNQEVLNFVLLDDVALAASRKRLPRTFLTNVKAERVGPLVEFLILSRGVEMADLQLTALSSSAVIEQLEGAARSQSARMFEFSDETRGGFLLTSRDPRADDQASWIAFCLSAQRAAEYSGLPKQQAQGLVGAMREIEENVHLHSQRAHDGLVAYRATKSEFEFVVADSGIGALETFRQSPEYDQLSDPGTALRLAVTDGESRLRYKEKGRGYGFHDLFVGLANLNGHLRFRSDDHALTIDGTSPSLLTARLSQTARLQGFVASVVCGVIAPGQVH